MIWTLVVKTWRDHWKSTLSWSIGTMAITVVELMVYPTVKKSAAGTAQLLETMPDAFKTIFRMSDYTSGPGFLGAELFSMMMPLIFIAIGANAGARATAEEESSGTADLLLTLPVSRTKIILAKTFAPLVVLLLLAVLLTVTLIIGSGFAGLVTPTSGVIAASFQVMLIGALFTSVALLIGALFGRKGLALGVSMALAIATFLLYSLAPLTSWLEHWLWLNPFQWAIGNDPLRNGLDVGHTITNLIVTAVLILLSVVAFNRRNITS
ncbi:ABC-2 family transporter protein [mine drainage metagenome]|uniref:ABC-2 family transporter protein n=1 Tax=mine drainage metagenome TaxID=410659 RepID=A0A1J5QEZ2_9ZZZZ